MSKVKWAISASGEVDTAILKSNGIDIDDFLDIEDFRDFFVDQAWGEFELVADVVSLSGIDVAWKDIGGEEMSVKKWSDCDGAKDYVLKSDYDALLTEVKALRKVRDAVKAYILYPTGFVFELLEDAIEDACPKGNDNE